METIRVRFAPSPTGFMHIGNVRAALINFLFARHSKGTFILRIEDTDTQRNVDPLGKKIISDIKWLGLDYDEGPIKGGPYGPYLQSERTNVYKQYLDKFLTNNLIYRCFCSPEELEKRRQRQIALKLPPKYDRVCLGLSESAIGENLTKGIPFIWRFKLPHYGKVEFYDLAHKDMSFDLNHFSDFAITRADGSFTFLFANFVDDVEMKITHIFRGEDHLTNTACQVAMYNTLKIKVPIFWHLPIITDQTGKKLSKRDFGFSLDDLKNAGFLPQAICNYLAILGGPSFKNEIMNLDELIKNIDFKSVATNSQIKYDNEKLRWLNHNWIQKLSLDELVALSKEYFVKSNFNISDSELSRILSQIQKELYVLSDAPNLLSFYFNKPKLDTSSFEVLNLKNYKEIINEINKQISLDLDTTQILNLFKEIFKTQNIQTKDGFALIRLLLIGQTTGPSIHDIIEILGKQETIKRLKEFKI